MLVILTQVSIYRPFLLAPVLQMLKQFNLIILVTLKMFGKTVQTEGYLSAADFTILRLKRDVNKKSEEHFQWRAVRSVLFHKKK